MANKPLELHPEAEEEYLKTLVWYSQRSQSAAATFETAIEAAMKKIHDAPARWPVYFKSCRKYTLHQFPFAVVYRVFPSHILILAVAHGHRRPGYWKNRL